MRRVRVGEVLALRRRPVLLRPDKAYEEIGIRSFGRGIFHKEAVSGATLGAKRVFRIEPGDLVISNVFAWEGAIALATAAEAGKIGSHRFMTFVPKDGRLDPSWAAWFLRSEPGQELIGLASPGSAGRNRTLAIARFEALKIPLPPIDEQRRVAERLRHLTIRAENLRHLRTKTNVFASAVPTSLRIQLEMDSSLVPTALGDVLEFVRDPVEVDLGATYVTIGMRSFGKGVFHYPSRPGAAIGKLRFQSVSPQMLAISNIKAWEGAVATTSDVDRDALASNRFLFFRPRAGEEATDYFWSLLLGSEGLAALGRASPGSADRNRTLAVDRFRRIKLMVPGDEDQVAIGRRLRVIRGAVAQHEASSERARQRVEALLPAALNEAFGGLT